MVYSPYLPVRFKNGFIFISKMLLFVECVLWVCVLVFGNSGVAVMSGKRSVRMIYAIDSTLTPLLQERECTIFRPECLWRMSRCRWWCITMVQCFLMVVALCCGSRQNCEDAGLHLFKWLAYLRLHIQFHDPGD